MTAFGTKSPLFLSKRGVYVISQTGEPIKANFPFFAPERSIQYCTISVIQEISYSDQALLQFLPYICPSKNPPTKTHSDYKPRLFPTPRELVISRTLNTNSTKAHYIYLIMIKPWIVIEERFTR